MNNDRAVFIVDGVQVYADGKPVQQAPAPIGGEELEKSRADKAILERDSALQSLEKANLEHRVTLERLLNESQERVRQLDQAQQERSAAQQEAADVRAALARAQDDASVQASKISELEARPVLPGDALTRLTNVKGISAQLAQQALDALSAAPVPTES